jgi:spore germination cell wall hydrolase CwlJ-like protein
LATIRTALLFCLALSVTSISPAQAGPSAEPIAPAATPTVAQVAVPALLDPQGEPTLSDTSAKPEQKQDADDSVAASAEPVKPTGDLLTMVAQLRAPDAGSREIECLATGIYFESKSEPLAGQLAVGKVIANRAATGGRFPPT